MSPDKTQVALKALRLAVEEVLLVHMEREPRIKEPWIALVNAAMLADAVLADDNEKMAAALDAFSASLERRA